TDILQQVNMAKRCFSFYSTLLIPIIYIKHHCIVFDLGLDIGLQKELIELGVVTKLDVVNFTYEQLTSEHSDRYSDESYKEFVLRYINYNDGKATNRLKRILQSDNI